MYRLYRSLTWIASPVMPLVLRARLKKGKEDKLRLQERLGNATRPRPHGTLVWIHAASIGEANAALPVITRILSYSQTAHVLLTTVTVTSSELMKKHLPERAFHQFAPVDTPAAVEAFLRHWHPDVGVWVDSELWPNLIVQAHTRGMALGLINARMSERSFRRWSRVRFFIRQLLQRFSFCFAQSELDAQRLRLLGVPTIQGIGSLKYDAPALPYDDRELARLSESIGGRPVWLAASTHRNEEDMIAKAHTDMKAQGIPLLTIIVPRHAARGEAIAASLAPLAVARRSQGDIIDDKVDIYLADTMGELGLFYTLSPVVFMGGSLVPHGGQNPLEPARLGCAILTGPHTENFAAITATMLQEGACLRVQDAEALAVKVKQLFAAPLEQAQLAQAARRHVQAHGGQVSDIMKALQPYLS